MGYLARLYTEGKQFNTTDELDANISSINFTLDADEGADVSIWTVNDAGNSTQPTIITIPPNSERKCPSVSESSDYRYVRK